MGIRVVCPSCGHQLNVKEFLAGKRGICPHCQARFDIPAASTEPSADTPAAPQAAPAATQAQPTPAQPVATPQVAATSQPAVSPPSPAPAPAPPTVEPAPVATPSPAAQEAAWYVRPATGGQFGPANDDVMQQWVAEGRVPDEALVWRTGWADWQRADQVELPGQATAIATQPTLPAGEIANPNGEATGEVGQKTSPTPAQAAANRLQRKRKAAAQNQAFYAIVLLIVAAILFIVLVVVLNQPPSNPSNEQSNEPPPITAPADPAADASDPN